MARIGPKDSSPELRVRKVLHRLGYRFRLHRRELPGTPDICFIRKQKVIFVHGCFWHRHDGCKKTTSPKTRVNFWEEKFVANKARDGRNIVALNKMGWKVAVVWECESNDPELLERKLKRFLGSPQSQ